MSTQTENFWSRFVCPTPKPFTSATSSSQPMTSLIVTTMMQWRWVISGYRVLGYQCIWVSRFRVIGVSEYRDRGFGDTTWYILKSCKGGESYGGMGYWVNFFLTFILYHITITAIYTFLIYQDLNALSG